MTGSAGTARALLVARLPTARRGQRAGDVAAALGGATFDVADAVYVVDERGRLEGAVPLTQLLAAGAASDVGDLMLTDTPRAHPEMDQEDVATLAHEHGLASVPVTDADGVLVGVVPAEVLIDVLRREHIEDIHRLAGIGAGAGPAREALYESPVRRLRHRLPWLLVGLAGSMGATAVVASFERSLEETVAIAFFVPGIVYLADAIGTQTEAVAVRGLSLGPVSVRRLLGAELAAGLLIGLVLGLVALASVTIVFDDGRLALAVGIAILVAGGLATTIGLLFPLVLDRLGSDPAFGSGPVATIVQDVLSLLAYFVTAQLLV